MYAYRGDRNTKLGKAWRGAILNNPVKITDHCTDDLHNQMFMQMEYRGLTFDKWKTGVYNTS